LLHQENNVYGSLGNDTPLRACDTSPLEVIVAALNVATEADDGASLRSIGLGLVSRCAEAESANARLRIELRKAVASRG
jgi:hypothetical protein